MSFIWLKYICLIELLFEFIIGLIIGGWGMRVMVSYKMGGGYGGEWGGS